DRRYWDRIKEENRLAKIYEEEERKRWDSLTPAQQQKEMDEAREREKEEACLNELSDKPRGVPLYLKIISKSHDDVTRLLRCSANPNEVFGGKSMLQWAT